MRLFVAVGLDDGARQAVMAECQKLSLKTTGGHFTTAANLHLTLAFLGETDVMELPKMEQALAGIRFAAFPVTLGNLGRFSSGEKTILVLSTEGGNQLAELARNVRQALTKMGIRFDQKAFVPHLTLAREIVIADQDIKVVSDIPPITSFVRSFILMESLRETGTLVYRNRREFFATIADE